MRKKNIMTKTEYTRPYYESPFNRPNTGTNFRFAEVSGAKKIPKFYEGKINEIDLLMDFETLILSDRMVNFNYKKYIDQERPIEYEVLLKEPIKKDQLKFEVEKADPQYYVRQKALFDARLSTKSGNVMVEPLTSIQVHLDERYVDYSIYHVFDDTMESVNLTLEKLKSFSDEELVAIRNDSNAHKALAIHLKTDSVEKFLAYLDRNNPKHLVELKLEHVFKKAHARLPRKGQEDIERLRTFYEIVPPMFLKAIDDEKLFNDLTALTIHDDFDSFWDASKAIINFIEAFSDEEFIYNKLYDNPAIARKIYDVLNDDKDKEAYCVFLTALSCGYNFNYVDDAFPDIILLGGEFQIDSDLFFGENNSIHIKNDRVTPIESNHQYLISDVGNFGKNAVYGTAKHPEQFYRQNLLDKKYNPLDILFIENKDSGEITFVSAMQVKLMADRTEWDKLMKRIALGINLFLVALPFGLYVNGVRGLLFTLSVVEGSVAFLDIFVSGLREEIEQMPGGKTFLEYWDKFYALASITTGIIGLPDLIKSIGKFLTKGAMFIVDVTAPIRKQAILMMRFACLQSKELIQVIGLNFRIIYNTLRYRAIASFSASLAKLQRKGVLIIRVPPVNGTAKGIARYELVYDGVPIASGRTADELKKATKPFFGKNGEVLVEVLENMARRARVSNESLKILSKMADEALLWSNKRMPRACAVLEGNGVTIFNYSFKKKLPPGVYPPDLHPLIHQWLTEMWTRYKKGLMKLPEHHGKCAEVINISDWLKKVDPEFKMSIDEARLHFEGVVSHSRQIGDMKNGSKLKHGDYKEACDSCNPLLNYFNITEVKL
jgi:CRISPR/Cas system CSM-associated protein Csm2 small subunit